MIKICIIGNIGSGKSYVAKQFGYPIFSADLIVNQIYNENKKCYIKLNKKFPKIIKSFPINKQELQKLVLEKKNNIKKINKIVHPEVRLEMKKFLNKYKNKKIVILDIPLLLENKINKKRDIIVCVDAKNKHINERLKKRVNYNFKLLKILKKLQLPLEIKKKKSNFIIKNNFKSKLIRKSVKNILKKIL